MKTLELNSFNSINVKFPLLFLIITPLILIAFGVFYLEGVLGLEPCPLCSIQRGFFVLISFFSLITLLLSRFRLLPMILSSLGILSSILGLVVALRHVSLQYMDKSEVPACGPDLAYMLSAFPFNEIITNIFHGSGSCADIKWSFLYLSIPEWAVFCFLFYIIMLTLVFYSFSKKNQF